MVHEFVHPFGGKGYESTDPHCFSRTWVGVRVFFGSFLMTYISEDTHTVGWKCKWDSVESSESAVTTVTHGWQDDQTEPEGERKKKTKTKKSVELSTTNFHLYFIFRSHCCPFFYSIFPRLHMCINLSSFSAFLSLYGIQHTVHDVCVCVLCSRSLLNPSPCTIGSSFINSNPPALLWWAVEFFSAFYYHCTDTGNKFCRSSGNLLFSTAGKTSPFILGICSCFFLHAFVLSSFRLLLLPGWWLYFYRFHRIVLLNVLWTLWCVCEAFRCTVF